MRERELKLLVDDDAILALEHIELAGATLAERKRLQITDTYFDTESLRLARWGVTLRWREGTGWTVKIPHPSDDSAVLERDEIVVTGDRARPPAEAVDLVAAFARGEPLVEVAKVSTDRTTRTWRTPDGRAVGELADDRVVASTRRIVRFREIEFELAPDAAWQLFDPVRDALGAHDTSAVPKLVRALGDTALASPDVAVPVLSARPTAAEVIHAAIAGSVRRLLYHVPAARLGVDPEGVHQARVATRRLRSDLKTFAPLIDEAWAKKLRQEMRWLATELGEVRDADVLDGHLARVLVAHPEIDRDDGAAIRALLASQRDQHREDLLGHLADRRAIELFDHLVDAAAMPRIRRRADKPAADALPPLVDKTWRRLRRRVDTLSAHPEDADLHEIRILAKRVRYAAEAVAPALGKDATRFAKAAASIQDSLGDLHDAAIAATWLEQASRSFSGRAAFAAGRLAQQLRADAGDNRRQWTRSYDKMRRRRAWLATSK